MDSKDGNTISGTPAQEDEKDVPPSQIPLPQVASSDHEIVCQKTDEQEDSVETKTIPAESRSIADNSKQPEETSSAGSLSSMMLTDENKNICQGGETPAFVENLSPHGSDENISDDFNREINEALKPEVSPHLSADVMDYLSNVPEDLYSVAPNSGIAEAVPSTSSEQSMGINYAGFQGMIFRGKLKSLEYPNLVVTRKPSESEVYYLKTLAGQKLVQSVYKSAQASLQAERNKSQGPSIDTAKSSVIETSSNVIPSSEIEDSSEPPASDPEVEEGGESEKKAFFYISSSCSIPGMGEGSEWSGVSDGNRMPSERPVISIARQESREPAKCLGTQRCHYIIIAIALLTTVLGCIVYHMSDSGRGPEVLRPIGASTAFISFAVCVFSSIYLGYLSNYPQILPVVPNYELLGDVESVMAMHRASDQEFMCADDAYYASRHRTDVSEHWFRPSQSADVLDRRGYGRLSTGSQTDVKRYSEDSDKDYSSQPSKKFKAGTDVNPKYLRQTRLSEILADYQTSGIETDYGLISQEISADDLKDSRRGSEDEINGNFPSERSVGDQTVIQSNVEQEIENKQDIELTGLNSCASTELPPDSESKNDREKSDTKL